MEEADVTHNDRRVPRTSIVPRSCANITPYDYNPRARSRRAPDLSVSVEGISLRAGSGTGLELDPPPRSSSLG